ncbi:MAG: TVP38/TMEM64 family protein [Geminicoccaceae bacterium]|nr:TVP38/TMEM64 family protein [Geminicoccaceae bacterium]
MATEVKGEGGTGGWRRYWPLLALLLVAAAVWASGLYRYLSPDALKTHYGDLRGYVAAHPFLAPVAFACLYAVAVAVSLPGAALLTLASGLLFGTWLGAFLVVVGATAGAVVVFMVARTSLGEPLRRRAGPWLERMASGFREDAWSYMLFLRLVAVFPFWLVNIVPAFLGVPLRTYALATPIGIAPATVVYAGIGSGLGDVIERGGDIGLGTVLTPGVLLPLAGLGLLALLPIALKRWRRRKAA